MTQEEQQREAEQLLELLRDFKQEMLGAIEHAESKLRELVQQWQNKNS